MSEKQAQFFFFKKEREYEKTDNAARGGDDRGGPIDGTVCNGIGGGGRTHGIYVYIGVTHQAWVLEEGGEEGRK